MLLIIVRLLYVFVCAGAIASYVHNATSANVAVEGDSAAAGAAAVQTHANRAARGTPPEFVGEHPFASFVLLLGLSQLPTILDLFLRRKRIEIISAVYFGLLIGSLLAFLLNLAMAPVFADKGVLRIVEMMSILILPYVCISFLLQTKDDFRFIIPYVEFARELKGGTPLILDSSALIDGRIADLVETHILDSQLVVPDFVLHEVQDIADSSDKIRRTRGRRGLEILSKLQNSPKTEVKVYETKEKRSSREAPVDQMLVTLAKELTGRIVTNDFNLNKVASVQGIPVINLNDVSNALKPRYIPGERLRIKVLREGEGVAQGVGYLDDGTMVVCEQASNLIGKDIDVTVTSVLQSSAGRMIFGRQILPDPPARPASNPSIQTTTGAGAASAGVTQDKRAP